MDEAAIGRDAGRYRVSTLSNLLRLVEQKDAQLAADIANEVKALGQRRQFGLNFERHTPEDVELPGRPIRKGDKVRFLAERGASPKSVDQRLWRVTAFSQATDRRVATLVRQDTPESEVETTTRAVNDLVVVAEFRNPIYPGLVSTGKVERGGDKPFHTVINAENFHALQSLLYTHEGQVDAIYIDPPYNTGAKDWKYNNDYIDADDIYRHSKWLAFMERRLKIAKRLLNPDDSVLIVTIDEKEYLRLGLLLEQTFEGAKIQMISSVIKPGGTSRTKEFSRVEEYIYFVFFGSAELTRTGDNMLGQSTDESDGAPKLSESDLWEGMVRRGIGVVRSQRPKQFYPIFINTEAGRIVNAGEPLGKDVDRTPVPAPDGLTAVWPIKDDGTEGFWQLSPAGLETARNRGTVRVGTFNKKTGQWRIQYMKAKKAQAVESGLVATKGKDERGVVILDLAHSALSTESTPRTVWTKASHDASVGGAGLLNKLLPDRKFPYPKSLYAVEDSLRFFISAKPEAVVVDFFSGSGTTAHAVMRLNRQDGGRRRSISITNNEVSAEEQVGLRHRGLRPGDDEWEAQGICDFITTPRIRAAVTGDTPSGVPVSGGYKFTDEFPMSDGFEENVEFFTLTYEAPRTVAHNRAFEAIAPLLWIKAGAQGRRIEKATEDFDVADVYGVLFDMDYSQEFLAGVSDSEIVRMAFIVTDDDRAYQMVCSELPAHVQPVRLYESYLTNFTINTGRE